MWNEPFDFIHSANLAQGIRDWPTYTKQMYKYVPSSSSTDSLLTPPISHLAPGGVVQLHENEIDFKSDDDSIPKGGFIEQYQQNFEKAAALVGIQEASHKLEGYLLDAGFIDVKVVIKKLPMGPWVKDRKSKVRLSPSGSPECW